MTRSASTHVDPYFPRETDRPTHSLQKRAIVAVTLLIALPTALCGYVTHRHAARTLNQSFQLNAAAITNLAAKNINPTLHDPEALDEAVAHILMDPHVALVTVRNQDGQVVARGVNHKPAWEAYTDQGESTDPLTLNHNTSISLEDGSVLIIRRQRLKQLTPSAAQPLRADCVLTVGFHDPFQRQLLSDMRSATASVVVMICLLALPLALWWVRGWAQPLRHMLHATLQLGLGNRFDKIDIRRNDEIGMLARSFNAMASNLSTIQAALIQANEHLEHEVAQRTRQLENANTQLRHEMDEKDQFLRAITHDLGAPARNITGLATLLMKKHQEDCPPEILDKLERIAANARTETQLIGDLLELSHIKSRRTPDQAIDLNDLLKTIAQQFAGELERERIELSIQRDLPTLRAQRLRVLQVFQNLIENAIKFMPEDTPRRHITVEYSEQPVPTFRVIDTGRGIEERDLPNIFQVFQRGRYSGASHLPGRGVGLASVKAIVETLGGAISVSSRPGRGTTFSFTVDPTLILNGAGPDETLLHAGDSLDR
ncbi:MAG: sensor histidine kinase [Planctomycetota bacterium]|jgi:signal transduction histidine kinase